MLVGFAVLAAACGPGGVASSAGSAASADGPRDEPMSGVAESLTLRTEPGEEHPAVTVRIVDAGVVAAVDVAVRRDDVVLALERRTVDGTPWIQVAASYPGHFFVPIVVGWLPLEVDAGQTLAAFDATGCPATPTEPWAAHSILALACFSSSSVTIEGRLTASATPCREHSWEACGWFDVPQLDGLPLFLDDAAGATFPDEAEVRVTGHFDDPRAGRCGAGRDDPDERKVAVVVCRTSFVVDAIGPVPTPPADALRPELRFVDAATYADGKWIRYRFDTVNAEAFGDELFEAAPGLPACGGWDPAARTWARLVDEDGGQLSLVCGPGSAAMLHDLSFALPADNPPPEAVVLELHDRREDRYYRSKPVRPGP